MSKERPTLSTLFFTSEEHKKRFIEATQGWVDDGKIDPEYGATLYVLTSDLGTWNLAQRYITPHGILFNKILRGGWSSGERVLLQWTANLFNEQAATCNPVELMRLDERNFQVALSALLIRRYSVPLSELSK